MTELTLPGTIPGLLRQCSPVIYCGAFGWTVVGALPPPHIRVQPSDADGAHAAMPESLHLDLTEATGRAHAAWWAWEATRSVTNGREHKDWPAGRGPRHFNEESNAMHKAIGGEPMTDDEIVVLRDMCLAIANLRVTP